MFYRNVAFIFSFVLFVYLPSAQAALFTTFSDRTTFEAALTGNLTEDFESFLTEENFRTSALDIGDFTLSVTGAGDSSNKQVVDLPSDRVTGALEINGTNYVDVLLRSNLSVVVTFDLPTLGFGADFFGLNNTVGPPFGPRTTSLEIGTDSFLPAAVATTQFFGITSDTAFSSLIFTSTGNDGFSFDNVTYTQVGAVPVPPAVLLFGSAVMSMVLFRRRS